MSTPNKKIPLSHIEDIPETGIQSIQEGDNISIDNTDPLNPIVSAAGGGTTGESYIEVTKSELDTHITNSTLKSGVLYGIKETERWMLLGDSTDTLFLRAISPNQLESKGMGKFFVPKYDQSIDGYGIWQGEVYNAFPTTVLAPNYVVNDKVIWGGRLWNNVSGNLGTKVNIYTLSADWEAIPFNETDYNVRFDKIEYDYQNDMVIYRKDDNGNEISTSYEDWKSKRNSLGGGTLLNTSLWNSLKIYQWGNEVKGNKGCGSNIVKNSILQCLNTHGNIYSNILNYGLIYSNTLVSNGRINSNTLENNGKIYSNTLYNGYIDFNTLNNGQIIYNTLNNGYIRYNTVKNYGSIYFNTLNGGQIVSNTLNNGKIEFNTLENFRLIDSNTLENGKIHYNTLNGGNISSNTLEYGGNIYSNTLNNGNIDYNIIEVQGYITHNTLGNGNISYNTLENNGYIDFNTLNNGNIISNTVNNGIIEYNTLDNGYIRYNTLENYGQIRLGLANTINGKTIQYLTIDGGDIGGNSGINLSSATLVYADFTREVFKNSAGVTKIKYFNENDVLVVADITD